ncbi:hypothetical protein [Rathayibacter sp. Leaf248]|uniref:hypothetical protein n=1 Tax=Rathayibacter sp. Leaf248 TaxID=2876555 RepID=UPI001E3AA78D|nr:hypothetical protein [Rathayibacter sp. Leaf248]
MTNNPKSRFTPTNDQERPSGRHAKPATELAIETFTNSHSTANSEAIRECLRVYGEPFAAYLALSGADIDAADIEEDFRATHWGSYNSMTELVDEYLDGFNGRTRVAKLLTELGLDPSMVRWDYDACEALIRQELRLVEAYGYVHAFTYDL